MLLVAAVQPGRADDLVRAVERVIAGRAEVRAVRVPPGATAEDLEEIPVPEEGVDVVIWLAAAARHPDGALPRMPGAPVVLRWSLPAGGSVRDAERSVERLARESLREGVLDGLVRERRLLQAVLDTLEDGVLVHDERQRIQLFNRAAERITGRRRGEVLGRVCPQVFAPDGLCGPACSFCDSSPGPGKRFDKEITLVTPDGEQRRIRMALTTLPDGGGDDRLQVVARLRDVTEVRELRRHLRGRYGFQGMVAASNAMREVFETIVQVASSDYPVLISGESGTGKELVAHAIHNESGRRGGPFVPINCGALPENILESELFGHVRGAFTGAIRDKKGRFELAHRGTLFLDEVGELSPAFQVKLLRALQEKRFERVGGERTVEVDVRVVAATNRDLRAMVAEGAFRQDLFYRLCVVPIELPPLRDRREDVPLLIEQVLADIRRETGKDISEVDGDALASLVAYHWPGNIRELINALQFASIRVRAGAIGLRHMPPEIVAGRGPDGPVRGAPGPRRRRKLTAGDVERALRETGGNKLRAAKLLGVGRATLYRFLADHGGLSRDR